MDLLRNKIRRGETVLGTMLSELANPNLARIMKVAGFELVIVDCEHGYFDFSQLGAIASLGKAVGLPVFARVPTISREWITKVLDMGCEGLLVPMVDTPEQAVEIVKFARYSPIGQRGISTMRAHTDYSPPLLTEYLKLANERVCILVQIETRRAVRNAAAIGAVEGIDALIIGPNDLASDFGTPGQFDTPEMMEAILKIIADAEKAGKPSGIISSNLAYLKRCETMGMSVFSCNSEVGLLMKAAKDCVKGFHS